MLTRIKRNIAKPVYKLVRSIFGLRDIIIFSPHSKLKANVHALYSFLVEMGYDSKYHFVWYAYENIPKNVEIYNHKKISHRFFYRACAKYVFYEDCCPVICKTKGQKVVYLSHGCPTLKNSRGHIDVSELKTTDALITSENVRETLAKSRQFPAEKMFVCGHPRNDVIFKSQISYEDFFSSEYEKIILWMPTFRRAGSGNGNVRCDSVKYLYGLPLISKHNDLERLNDTLIKKNTMLIIKPHPIALKEGIEEINYSNIVVWSQEYLDKNNINIYKLFKATDALISDYSSVVFDFMLADKPLAYIIDDIDEYKLGYAYDNVQDYMPGHKIKTLDDIELFIGDISENKDLFENDRHKINTWANKYHDGRNCERIVEMFKL